MSNNISTIGQTLDNNARLKSIQAQLYDLQTQLSSGKKSQSFVGLGAQAIGSLRNRAELTHIDVYQSNITIGITRSKQMLDSISEFKAQAKNISSAMSNQLQQGDIDLNQIKTFATDGLKYLRELLNSKDGDRYVFAGADAYNKPMDESGAHGTYAESQFKAWKDGTIDTDTLLANISATPETTMGYSAALSSGLARGVSVRADVNSDVDYTVMADNDGFKDILNSLALIDKMDIDKISLDDGDDPLAVDTAPGATKQEQKDNFFKLYESLIKKINTGMDKLQLQEEKLQRVELQLTNISDGHTNDKNTLETALGNIENADPTDVAVKISSLQVQLSAAYQVTARLGQLSLTQYL